MLVWEIVFMLVVLKIPVVYLGAVVWWAIRAEPLPDDPAEPVGTQVVDPIPPGTGGLQCDWRGRPLAGLPRRRRAVPRRPRRARIG
jgi:hypothetical protein